MNTVQNENSNSQNGGEVEEVQALPANATDEQKLEYYGKLESSNKQLYARLKKEQGFELKDGKWVKPSAVVEKKETTTTSKAEDQLSQTDFYTLVKADVNAEDIPVVVQYMKLQGVSVTEALKSPTVKGILAEKEEARRIANGTSTNAPKRGNAKVSDDKLLEDARSGKYPENDDDMKRLAKLSMGIKD